MGVYSGSAAAAIRMIKKFGGSVTWHTSVVAPNPAEPWKPGAAADVTHTVTVALVPMNERQYRKAQLLAKTDVLTGYEMAYMAQVPFTPTINDTLVRKDGTVYRIRSFDSIDVDGNGAILYEILVQR